MKVDVIDCRGFVKTPPTIPSIKKEFKVSGRGRRLTVAQSLKPSIR